jgi:hypothetical protein
MVLKVIFIHSFEASHLCSSFLVCVPSPGLTCERGGALVKAGLTGTVRAGGESERREAVGGEPKAETGIGWSPMGGRGAVSAGWPRPAGGLGGNGTCGAAVSGATGSVGMVGATGLDARPGVACNGRGGAMSGAGMPLGENAPPPPPLPPPPTAVAQCPLSTGLRTSPATLRRLGTAKAGPMESRIGALLKRASATLRFLLVVLFL